MKLKRKPLLGLTLALLFVHPYPAKADDPTVDDPQPYRCEDAIVTRLGNYFENDPTSGFYTVFRSKLGVEKFPEVNATVVDRGASPNSAMARQKLNDKVQVCLIYRPSKSPSCDPDRDPRGRVYRIFNYRLRAAYTGWNANHWCGGA